MSQLNTHTYFCDFCFLSFVYGIRLKHSLFMLRIEFLIEWVLFLQINFINFTKNFWEVFEDHHLGKKKTFNVNLRFKSSKKVRFFSPSYFLSVCSEVVRKVVVNFISLFAIINWWNKKEEISLCCVCKGRNHEGIVYLEIFTCSLSIMWLHVS